MMDTFLATLKARDPSLGRMRSYRLEESTDLLGAWLVARKCGRGLAAAPAEVTRPGLLPLPQVR
jgi:hypothetical protein